MKRAVVGLAFVVGLAPWACSSNDEGTPSPGVDSGVAHETGTGSDVTITNDVSEIDTAVADTSTNDAGTVTCAPASATPTPMSGDITADKSLTCDKVYSLSGMIHVQAPATLTIQQGTLLLMGTDASIVVAPGAKIVAVGTRDQPIVFTSAKAVGSRAPGDWGSLAIVGKAPGNWGCTGAGCPTAGAAVTKSVPDANPWPADMPLPAAGSDPFTASDYADSSGKLVYVRLEYGGSVRGGDAAAYDHEILGLYGVGNGTVIDYVDMRQANYGCLFAEGGSFDAKHLICQHGGNTAFGVSRGGKNRLQFVLDQDSPHKAAEGLGIKGPRDSNTLSPVTDPTVYNITVCGTNGSLETSKDPYGLFLKREPAGHVFNMIASGFRAGIAMRNGTNTQLAAGAQPATTELHNSVFFKNFDPSLDAGADADTNIAYGSPPDEIDVTPWFNTAAWKNSVSDPHLGNCFDATTFSMAPTTALTTGAATPPDDGFFDKTATYIGALKDSSDSWATGNWVVWSAN
jgi:hypothetical protein